jgi:hypothetical protein
MPNTVAILLGQDEPAFLGGGASFEQFLAECVEWERNLSFGPCLALILTNLNRKINCRESRY